jgi:hypothetical protein
MTAKIYIIHHEADKYPVFMNNDVVTPILAGPVGERGVRVPLKDTQGVGCITDKNKQDLYGEFTALWWVWKNVKYKDDDIVGFMHYRSFLDLNKQIPKNNFCFENRFGYTEETIRKFMQEADQVNSSGQKTGGKGVDILTSTPLKFDLSLYRQFDSCHPLAELLFSRAQYYLSKDTRFSGLSKYFTAHFNNNIGFYKCLYIWKYKYFCQFCEFLFYILDNLYKDVDVNKKLSELKNIDGPDNAATQKINRFRLFAFLGERLSSLFIAYNCNSGPAKVGLADIAHYENLSGLIKQVYPNIKDSHGRELKPLFRMLSHKYETHITVSDYKELDSLLAGSGSFHFEGFLGYCYKESGADRKPLLRLKRDGSPVKYYYDTTIQTKEWSIKIGDIAEYNYKNCKLDGTLGYVEKNRSNGFETDNLYLMYIVWNNHFGFLCAPKAEAEAIRDGLLIGPLYLFNSFFDKDVELLT